MIPTRLSLNVGSRAHHVEVDTTSRETRKLFSTIRMACRVHTSTALLAYVHCSPEGDANFMTCKNPFLYGLLLILGR